MREAAFAASNKDRKGIALCNCGIASKKINFEGELIENCRKLDFIGMFADQREKKKMEKY